MNIPVLSKNEEGLEGLVKKQHRKKPGKLEFSRRLLQHNWMRLFYEVRQTNIIMYEYSCGRFRAKKINSALKIAAVRGEVDDLPARCISLLKEVKEVMPPIGEWCRIFDHSSLLIQQPVPLLPLQDLKRLKNPGSFKSKGPELVSGRFAYVSFRLQSVRLRIESIRLRLICQFAYESDVEALNRNY